MALVARGNVAPAWRRGGTTGMRYEVGCRLGYEVGRPGPIVLNVRPALTAQQRVVEESLTLTPETAVQSWTMPESGNRYDRLVPEAGPFEVHYEATVDLDVTVVDPATVGETAPALLPFEVLPHTYPSRYCESDRLMAVAARLFGGLPPGHQRVAAVCNWIHDNVDYIRGTSDQHTSAADTLVERAGVCRDFAHLGVGLTRALGIPGRFASGYALGLTPPDFHAVFEAFLDGRWYLFDATRQAVLDGIVRIGVGLDAAEVAFGTMAAGIQGTSMEVWIRPADGAIGDSERTTQAITIAST